jgi:apolipoprotein D and lipocalin family protein
LTMPYPFKAKGRRFVAALIAALMMTAPTVTLAEPAVVRVTPDHYSGTWLEIGRRPMWLTDGCVAGYTTYSPGPVPELVMVEDGCRMGSPEGELKTVRGIGTIKDLDSDRAKLRVRYKFLITMNYWVLYKAPDKSWFISADPGMKDLWIYARKAPSRKQLARMTAKAAELGYDVRKLEFPEPAR